MIRLIIFLVLIYFAYHGVKSVFGRAIGDRREPAAGEIDDVMIKDPHCQAYFPRRDGVPLESGGQRIYFCSAECRDSYLAGIQKRK